MDKRKFGWRPDLPDHRDFLCSLSVHPELTTITKTDLRPQLPPVYDQGDLGACTGNSIAAAIEFCEMKENPKYDTSKGIPSRLFIYYNERVIEHSIESDCGASIRDGIKVVNSLGVCPETIWPYIENKFADKPTPDCYKAALKNKAIRYERLNQSALMLRNCLAQGYPFVFGFTVYESFMSDEVAKTGIVPMPKSNDNSCGGHAVLCVGYNDEDQTFLVRNSWNTSWGMGGYFTLPYQYILNNSLAEDFWSIRYVTE